MKYGFIGFGHLAQAIYLGLKDNPDVSFAYTSKHNQHPEIPSFSSLEQLVSFADVLWLCVKPQDLAEVLASFKNIRLKDKIIVSPVASKSISFIEGHLGQKATIVRIMPNLAIAYQKSVTAFFTKNKKSPLVARVKDDLQKLGTVMELPEKHFDLFTAIFGSGPAFLLTILQVFKNKIKELGLNDSEGNDLLIQLASGTLTYFQKNQARQSLEDLIKNITSSGGTTEAGLDYFKKNKLDKLLAQVFEAAENRSKEILN